jgi:protein-disulfide isomerase
LDHEFNRIIAPDPFHIGSGRLALIAIVAADHGSFWAVNDALYQAAQSQKDSIEIEVFARLMQISAEQLATEMFKEKTLRFLQHDMVQGLQHGITGTPSFVVDGKVYQKSLPSELLEEIIK